VIGRHVLERPRIPVPTTMGEKAAAVEI